MQWADGTVTTPTGAFARRAVRAAQNWTRMSFSQYASWFEQSLDLHVQLAAAWGKPLIVEEFNILST